MSRDRSHIVEYVTGAVIVVTVLVLLGLHGKQLLWDYGWVLFPGIFVLAAAARAVEILRRRARLRRFRS